jgi:uncharacterized protein
MKHSCIYECTVMHHRLEPMENRFQYRFFMFCLDLDELDELVRKNIFISRNKFNLFNFRDSDHLQLPKENPDYRKKIKAHLLEYLQENGVEESAIGRIMLVTNLCMLGHQFNPVSFYFCFDKNDHPLCSVAEVGNTFGEMKLYFLGSEQLEQNRFSKRIIKNFYVSPFMAMDTEFHFILHVPNQLLSITIHDYQKGEKIFISTLRGVQKPLTDRSLIKYAIRFPLVTVQIITQIHWQAFKLWLRKMGYHKKNSFPELQQNVLRPHKSLIQ